MELLLARLERAHLRIDLKLPTSTSTSCFSTIHTAVISHCNRHNIRWVKASEAVGQHGLQDSDEVNPSTVFWCVMAVKSAKNSADTRFTLQNPGGTKFLELKAYQPPSLIKATKIPRSSDHAFSFFIGAFSGPYFILFNLVIPLRREVGEPVSSDRLGLRRFSSSFHSSPPLLSPPSICYSA